MPRRYILVARCEAGRRTYLWRWEPGYGSWTADPEARVIKRFTLRKARHVRRVACGRLVDIVSVDHLTG